MTTTVDAATRAETVGFYRATGEYGFLSNLYRCSIVYEGREFPTAEHAYQFGKPKDPAVREWLMLAPKPHLVAVAAHALFVFDVVPNWNAIKVDRMRDVLGHKFRQRGDLAVRLLATGDARLIEQSATDAFWGIGRAGTGRNMLGALLMELRGELAGA